MSSAPRRIDAVTAIEEGSAQDRIARALYDHDSARAVMPWHPWRQATRPKRLLYLSRAAAVLAALDGERADRPHSAA